MRSLITGTSFGDNILAVLPDVIGNVVRTIGARAASGVVERTVAAAKAKAPMLKVDKDAYGLDDDTVTGGRTTTSAVQNSSYRDTITKMGIASLPGPAKYALARMASDAANMGEIEVQAPYHRGKLARTSNLATKGMSFIDEPEENITPSVENAHGMHASTSIKIKSAEQARAVIAEWRAVFAEYGMQDNGFEILVGLKTRELMWDVKEGFRKTDDLIPFSWLLWRNRLVCWAKSLWLKTALNKQPISASCNRRPGSRPETDWLWSPWQTTKQQIKYDIALKFMKHIRQKLLHRAWKPQEHFMPQPQQCHPTKSHPIFRELTLISRSKLLRCKQGQRLSNINIPTILSGHICATRHKCNVSGNKRDRAD